jgi:hypothetical protein
MLPILVAALEELGADDGWIAVRVHDGGVRDARVWPAVEGGKPIRGRDE